MWDEIQQPAPRGHEASPPHINQHKEAAEEEGGGLPLRTALIYLHQGLSAKRACFPSTFNLSQKWHFL